MRNKSLFKLIAILMLAVGLIVTPAIDFFEPAVAVAAKKKTAKKKHRNAKAQSRKVQSKNQAAKIRVLFTGVQGAAWFSLEG